MVKIHNWPVVPILTLFLDGHKPGDPPATWSSSNLESFWTNDTTNILNFEIKFGAKEPEAGMADYRIRVYKHKWDAENGFFWKNMRTTM